MSEQIISTVVTRHWFMKGYWTWEQYVFIDCHRLLLIGSPYYLQIVLMRIVRRLLPWIFSCAPAAALPTFWPLQDDGGQAQQQQPVPVTGVTTGLSSGTGERPARWEINALQEKGGPRW